MIETLEINSGKFIVLILSMIWIGWIARGGYINLARELRRKIKKEL